MADRASSPPLRLIKPLRAAISAGHPWVFARALERPDQRQPGEVAELVDGDGPLGWVFCDPSSPIGARVLARPGRSPAAPEWAQERARACAQARQAEPSLRGCTGIRWIHGENDGCPGLVIDGYADCAVVVYDGRGAEAFWQPRLGPVLAGLRAGGAEFAHVWVRGVRGEGGGHAHRGDPPALIEIAEHQARFAVDVRHGQKTGFFLDQRDNRRTIGAHARDRSVLNICAYTGGFSVHAALGGARQVTSVDLAAPAMAACEGNLARSGVGHVPHEAVVADAFTFLAEAARARRSWDIVITDPPSFAPNEKARPAAIAAYRRLAELALGVVAPGGLYAMASCSSHVTESDLLGALAAAAAPRGAAPDRDLRIVQIAGAAADHPLRPGFVEGRYLKWILSRLGG